MRTCKAICRCKPACAYADMFALVCQWKYARRRKPFAQNSSIMRTCSCCWMQQARARCVASTHASRSGTTPAALLRLWQRRQRRRRHTVPQARHTVPQARPRGLRHVTCFWAADRCSWPSSWRGRRWVSTHGVCVCCMCACVCRHGRACSLKAKQVVSLNTIRSMLPSIEQTILLSTLI